MDLLTPPAYNEDATTTVDNNVSTISLKSEKSDEDDLCFVNSLAPGAAQCNRVSSGVSSAVSSKRSQNQLQCTHDEKDHGACATHSTCSCEKQYSGDLSSVTCVSHGYYDLDLEGCDLSQWITKTSFELTLNRLYGAIEKENEQKCPVEMILTGKYFGLPDQITVAFHNILNLSSASCSSDTDSNFMPDAIASKLTRALAFSNRKGWLFTELSEFVSCYFIKFGWFLPLTCWNSLSIEQMTDIVTRDYFFIASEYERALFIIQLIKHYGQDTKRGKALQIALNEGVVYSTMSVSKLQKLKTYLDKTGEPFVSPVLVADSVAQSYNIQSHVLRSYDSDFLNYQPQQNQQPRLFTFFNNDVDFSSPYPLINHITASGSTPSLNTTDYGTTAIPPLRMSFVFDKFDQLTKGKVLITKSFFYSGSYWRVLLGERTDQTTGENYLMLGLSRDKTKLRSCSSSFVTIDGENKTVAAPFNPCHSHSHSRSTVTPNPSSHSRVHSHGRSVSYSHGRSISHSISRRASSSSLSQAFSRTSISPTSAPTSPSSSKPRSSSFSSPKPTLNSSTPSKTSSVDMFKKLGACISEHDEWNAAWTYTDTREQVMRYAVFQSVGGPGRIITKSMPLSSHSDHCYTFMKWDDVAHGKERDLEPLFISLTLGLV
ncbi:unnamed protein product [Ambrosiozyma monospora]|uniref:Unnamed protein product n=1 Tax=Ambrosiozyma monospora TaxID=43982 RepID=A0ACB5SRM0_AMBMO|nr:unnamed protein product [Ambrosiozyma monospora]